MNLQGRYPRGLGEERGRQEQMNSQENQFQPHRPIHPGVQSQGGTLGLRVLS